MEILTTGTVKIAASRLPAFRAIRRPALYQCHQADWHGKCFDLATENTRTLNQLPTKGELICIYLPAP